MEGGVTERRELNLIVRALAPADVPAVVKIEKEIFDDPWSETVFLEESRGGARSWNRVAVDAETDTVVAYLVSWFLADEAHLANIAVVPGARRSGVADRMIRLLETEGRRRNARLILLEVRRSNQAAQALYRKHDFYTVMVRKRYYENREDALVMIKPLRESGRIPPVDAG